jgi:hypothetical protein
METCSHCGGSGLEPEDLVTPNRKLTKALANDGMSRAEAHAHVVWKAVVKHAIRLLAQENEYLNSDDVRVWMDSNRPTVKTHNLSALGPMMTKAARLGWIESVDTMRSEIPVTHGKHITLWRSKLYVDLT